MEKGLLIAHGGGPTAVLNASLYGVIKEAKRQGIKNIIAAKNGIGGILRENLISLNNITERELELLLNTPGSAIGTSREALTAEDYDVMLDILTKNNIGYVLLNGGNGTMDACGKLYHSCCKKNVNINVIGIPKTTDNDLAVTDHSPGFGSAARYIAQSVREVCIDVASLPIHVVVIETSGRNAGWIAAASSLASDGNAFGPDLIYLPERPFSEDKFISDIKEKLRVKRGVVVVVSEGLKNIKGEPIAEPVFETDRAVYFGDVGAYLANLVIKRLGYKARSEKPGLFGRSSIAMQSRIDRDEAVLVGKYACKSSIDGYSGKMVALKRISSTPYKSEPFLTDIDNVMMCERLVPDEFINEEGNGVTEAFKEWCHPLIGECFGDTADFSNYLKKD